MSEILQQGIVISVIGIVIVFVILIGIALLLSAFAKIFVDNSKKDIKTNNAVEPASSKVQNTPDKALANLIDDKELVAVITAAIAASMDVPVEGLVIRSLRRVNTWNREAVQEQQNIY